VNSGDKANKVQIAICTFRSAKAGSVPDETISAIDRIFDFIDSGVDAADRMLHRGKLTDEKLQQTARGVKRREVIDAAATTPKPAATKPAATKPAATKPAATNTAVVAKRPHFYIVESVDPRSGSTLFVVTDGGNARTECATREFAATILRALEKAP